MYQCLHCRRLTTCSGWPCRGAPSPGRGMGKVRARRPTRSAGGAAAVMGAAAIAAPGSTTVLADASCMRAWRRAHRLGGPGRWGQAPPVRASPAMQDHVATQPRDLCLPAAWCLARCTVTRWLAVVTCMSCCQDQPQGSAASRDARGGEPLCNEYRAVAIPIQFKNSNPNWYHGGSVSWARPSMPSYSAAARWDASPAPHACSYPPLGAIVL